MTMAASIFTRYALRSLATHRARTCATAVGIALACGLLTAAFALFSSIQAGMAAGRAAQTGSWQIQFSDINESQLTRAEEELGCELGTQLDMGAAATGSPDLPVVNVLTAYAGPEGLVRVPALADGRWPGEKDEVALPVALAELYPVGSVAQLAAGRRRVTEPDGSVRVVDHTQSLVWQTGKDGTSGLAEALEDAGEPRAFTVVGHVGGSSESAYVSADVTTLGPEPFLTAWAAPGNLTQEELVRRGSSVCAEGGSSFVNDALLSYQGLSSSNGLQMSFAAVAAALCALIGLVAVVLVSGTFRLSLAERTRQLGLLSSVGASRRQLVRIALTEAALVGVPSVLAGAALGPALAALALPALESASALLFGGGTPMLSLSALDVAVPCAVAAAALLASALVPALRVSRMSAVEALRATEAQGRRPCQRGHGLLSSHCLPGLLARRFRRAGRARSRATTFSLALAVALLVGSGAFAAYQGQGAEQRTPADLTLTIMPTGPATGTGGAGAVPHLAGLLARIRELADVQDVGFSSRVQLGATFDAEALEPWAQSELWLPEGQNYEGCTAFATLYLVDDATWDLVCTEAGAAGRAGGCVFANMVRETRTMDRRPATKALVGTNFALHAEEGEAALQLEVVGLLDHMPAGLWLDELDLTLFPAVLAPASAVPADVLSMARNAITTVYVATDNVTAARQEVENVVALTARLRVEGATDEASYVRQERALREAIQAVLSLVGVVTAVVALLSSLNATAAGILMRTRDLAVLSSVGMSEKDLRRMLVLECAGTAVPGMTSGLAVALAFDVWLYASGSLAEHGIAFSVPWAHLALAVALGAGVVAGACAWALRRLRDTPAVEALRAEA